MTLERNALVWGVVSNLGGGKTMTAVRMAVENMARGYFVVSNVSLKIDEICRFYNAPWMASLNKH